MQRAFAALATVALLATPLMAQEATMPPDAAIEQILADRITRDQANVAIAVAVIEGGVSRFISHGTLSKDDPTPVDEHTLFEAGSITKLMTNLLLAQLVVDGQIDLDAPLTDYLPEGTVLPERDGKVITAFDLATHSAGFSGLPEALIAKGAANPYSGYGADELMAWIASYELPRAIGTQFEYSNVGIALLAQAIEHVSGKPYAELLQEQIFDPLGMTETSLATAPGTIAGMAQGHDAAGEPVPNWDMEAFAPVGALVTNTTDLAKFIAAASGAVESPLTPAFAIMLDRTRPTGGAGEVIGLGWFNLTEGGRDIAWHNGITGGYRSFAGYDRKTGNGVVVLSSMVTEAGIEDIGLHLLDSTLPLRPQPKPREVAEIDLSILPDYAGQYLLAPGVTIAITTEDDRLFAQLTGQERFEIFPESERRFFFRVVDAQITFADPVEGAAPSLMLHQNGQNMTAIRVP
ncbi:serine hydrolase [Devosia ginsengisoli]|uniref:serine hydrolase n=1 Tax=Devosia ginsengisoli TaxID=400770 RepID=UPI0026F259D7|nr:serine hydrolase [Devosia ginsengisoli]MCR6671173.1 serine hydrolase [Devosia ginsengisoli]